MPVKIVTDSGADLPNELAEEMGIAVVPVYVRFGEEVHRDRVSISEDEFYERLTHDPVHPILPSPDHRIFLRFTRSCQQTPTALFPSISPVN